MFDVTVAAPWPKGVYLCKRFQERGLKACYVETAAEKGPLALFLNESCEKELAFWLRLFFLEKIKGGLSIASEQGVWSLQRAPPPAGQLAYLKARKGDLSGRFQDTWLSFFAINYTGRLFVHNTSAFGARPLPLFEECFLIQRCAAKKRRFLDEEAGFLWIHGAKSQLKIEGEQIFLNGRPHKSRKTLLLCQPSFEALRPDFQWMSLVFACDIQGGYEEIVPPHFILIDRLRSPWALGNMLSVFKERRGLWRVWARAPLGISSDIRKALIHAAGAGLRGLFKTPVRFLEFSDQGFAVYGEQARRFLKKNRPLLARFPEGLQLQGEKELLEQTLKSL